MKPRFFARPSDFRAWLEAHHLSATELLVGFYKKGSGRASITWPESVDQALCFGWIDGVRRRVDDERYSIRFTPRQSSSTWSAVNIDRVADLKKMGLMRPAGFAAFERRSEKKSRTYSYERKQDAKLDEGWQRTFEANERAWAFFQAQPPGYRRVALHWVTSAKKADTRAGRLDALIAASAASRRL